jgi:DNA-binding MarR family transcriptional regulator
MSQHPLFMDLLKSLYWFDNALQSGLKKSGFEAVTRAQSLILLNIMVGESRAARLANNLGVSRQAMSQMLGEMEKRGLITFKADDADKRAQIVMFSAESRDMRNAAMRILARLERELEKRIGARNVAALQKALAADWGPSVIER